MLGLGFCYPVTPLPSIEVDFIPLGSAKFSRADENQRSKAKSRLNNERSMKAVNRPQQLANLGRIGDCRKIPPAGWR